MNQGDANPHCMLFRLDTAHSVPDVRHGLEVMSDVKCRQVRCEAEGA